MTPRVLEPPPSDAYDHGALRVQLPRLSPVFLSHSRQPIRIGDGPREKVHGPVHRFVRFLREDGRFRVLGRPPTRRTYDAAL